MHVKLRVVMEPVAKRSHTENDMTQINIHIILKKYFLTVSGFNLSHGTVVQRLFKQIIKSDEKEMEF